MALSLPGGDALRVALDTAGADGWLLYDFQSMNPVTRQVLGLTGMGSRRLFVYLPAQGEPEAVVHRIEMQPFEGFAGRVRPYSRWEELHEALGQVVRGRRVAMEVSADDAVPYLDRVPSGLVQLITRLGGTVVGSAPLVTRFASGWSEAEQRSHSAAAEALARIAQAAIRRAVSAPGTGLRESALQAEVARAIADAGLVSDHGPIVGFGPNSANPHYFPEAGSDRELGRDEVVLVDLFGGPGLDQVQADQTWIGFSGPRPPERVQQVWETVKAAREAAIGAVQAAWRSGRAIRGYEVDRASREVIERAGYGAWFVHRTGHSIDRKLHGSGPHLDDYETRDDRVLLPGVGFSVEPGIYIQGEFGMRTEVNMYLTEREAVVTPGVRQEALIVP